MSRYFDNKELFVGPTTKQYGSHMVTTNVIKESKIKYINIDSRFRDEYNYSNLANYYFTLPERINDVKTVSICNIELPLSVFNISADLGNNYFRVFKTSSALDSSMVDVSYGFYQLTPFYGSNPLKTDINAALANKGASNLSIDFSNNYNNGNTKMNTYNGFYSQFKNAGPAPITVDFAVSSTGSFDKYNLKGKLGWQLGFRDLSYTIPSGGTIYSEAFVNLRFPRYLYVVIDEFSRGNQSSFISPLPSSLINKNIIARISIDYKKYEFGDIVVGNQFNGVLLSDSRSYTGKTDLQKLNVQIVNEWGVPINLNGLDFSFTLVVEHE
jgi:hypothetical protein